MAKLKKKNWALVTLVFAPVAILPVSILFGELGIVQFNLPDNQPTIWGFVVDISVVWVLIAVPILLFPYFFDLYRGTQRRGSRFLGLICVVFVLYAIPYIILTTLSFIPNSILWFYVSPFLTLLAGYAIKGGRSNVTNQSQQTEKTAQDMHR